MTKKWYASKVLWVNIVGFIIIVLSYFGQVNWLDPKIVGLALTVLNFALRLITSQPISS
jgi:hypothetical protein